MCVYVCVSLLWSVCVQLFYVGVAVADVDDVDEAVCVCVDKGPDG